MTDKKAIAQFLGENLKKIRTEKGVSRRELGDAIGVTEIAIGQYEREIRQPTVEKAAQIADFFKLPIADFFSINPKLFEEKIFEYRLKKAYQMARDFLEPSLNAQPNFDKAGRIVIHSAEKIKNENGVIRIYGGYNSVAFKNEEDFVKVMEQAEYDALRKEINFNQAFRDIVFRQAH